MNKGTKIVIGIMMVIILGYVLANVYQNAKIEEKVESNQSGDSNGVTQIEYRLESGENEITITASGSGETSITRYLFSGDELVEIEVEERIAAVELIDAVFESIQSDETMSQIYADIAIKENRIVMKLKEEYVKSYAGKGKQEIYEELENEF